MLRRKPLKRTPFRSRIVRKAGPDVEREPKPLARSERAGVYAGSTRPVPKPQIHRNRRLLDMAADKPCLLLAPVHFGTFTDTTVAAHSNWADHGKAGARKANDHWSCWACAACHRWLDQGPAAAEIKRAVFDAGMQRQILAWKLMVVAPEVSDAERRAARWALALHAMEQRSVA